MSENSGTDRAMQCEL